MIIKELNHTGAILFPMFFVNFDFSNRNIIQLLSAFFFHVRILARLFLISHQHTDVTIIFSHKTFLKSRQKAVISTLMYFSSLK